MLIKRSRVSRPAALVALGLTVTALAAEPAAQHWLPRHPGPLGTDAVLHALPLPQAHSAPTTVAVAPDGRIWFTEGGGDRIGRMNPDGSGLAEYPLPHAGSAPRIIALGADGNMWFSEHLGNRIGRITPEGVISEFEIPTPASQPRAIALAPDGNIWFGMFAGGKIGRITPQGVITEFTPPTPDSGPRAVAVGADGNIWFSEYRANRIGRVTPQGVFSEFPLPRPNSGPGDITAGADGALWFVELSGGLDGTTTDGNRVGRISLDGKVTEYPLPAQGSSPINIALGPDHNLWYTRGAVAGRVTAAGVVTEFPLSQDSRTAGLSAGADRRPPGKPGSMLVNRLWFADSGANAVSYFEFKTGQAPSAAASSGQAASAPVSNH